jgi:steroid 5-alpha reductase family enzyme
MIRTALLLILAVIVLPLVAFYLDAPLLPLQKEWVTMMAYLMVGVSLTCFLVSTLTGNCSQVDKLWSIVPIIYVTYFAYQSHFDPRMTLMAALVLVWGARLTYNFSRRGAYSWKFWTGEEDYRWEVLRQMPAFKSKLSWMLFNLFFISLYQNTLILLFTLPIVVAWQGHNVPLGIWDIVLASLMLGFIVMETVADQQQYNYQTEKYRRKNAGLPLDGNYAKGFVDTGLWGLIRHPNYTAEQSIWIVYYLFSVVATGHWINWSLTGAVLLLMLFQGSSDFSENISAEKYPAYKDYQQKVPRFIPKFW